MNRGYAVANNPGTCGPVALRAVAVSLALLLALWTDHAAVAQEQCFQDERGRIVTRQRPGYLPVPCPGLTAPPGAA